MKQTARGERPLLVKIPGSTPGGVIPNQIKGGRTGQCCQNTVTELSYHGVCTRSVHQTWHHLRLCLDMISSELQTPLTFRQTTRQTGAEMRVWKSICTEDRQPRSSLRGTTLVPAVTYKQTRQVSYQPRDKLQHPAKPKGAMTWSLGGST